MRSTGESQPHSAWRQKWGFIFQTLFFETISRTQWLLIAWPWNNGSSFLCCLESGFTHHPVLRSLSMATTTACHCHPTLHTQSSGWLHEHHANKFNPTDFTVNAHSFHWLVALVLSIPTWYHAWHCHTSLWVTGRRDMSPTTEGLQGNNYQGFSPAVIQLTVYTDYLITLRGDYGAITHSTNTIFWPSLQSILYPHNLPP